MRVHHPLQQGLRQLMADFAQLIRFRASASSITTRIKTRYRGDQRPKLLRVRVHHPLQQGLRQVNLGADKLNNFGASASSITTRIKTIFEIFKAYYGFVRVHHPLQQGLRLQNYSILYLRRLLCECIIHYNKD